MEATLAALLDPLYFSFRKHGDVWYDIEVGVHGRGVVHLAPSQRQREIYAWRVKSEIWKNDERLSSVEVHSDLIFWRFVKMTDDGLEAVYRIIT